MTYLYELTHEDRIALAQYEWEQTVDRQQAILDELDDMKHQTVKAADHADVELTLWEEYHRLEERQAELEDALTNLGAKGWVST